MNGEGDSFLERISGELIDVAGEYIRSGGVRVAVKTNLGPELEIFDGGGARGVAQVLGLRAGVVVRQRDGTEIARYGDPAPTDPLRVIVLLTFVALLGFIIVRGVLK